MSAAVLDVAKLDAGERDALERLITTLADSKRIMGLRYSDWLLGAPSIEMGIATSSMAQDEWGHARLLYSMLKELDVDPRVVEHERDAGAYASVDALDDPFDNWTAVIAGMVVVDGALTVALEAFGRGAFESARTRIPKMLAEEEFHSSLATAWFRRLAASTEEARGLLRDATVARLPTTLAWLAADDEAARSLVAAGVTDAGASQVGVFRDHMRDVLADADIDVGAIDPSTDWDAARGRGPGAPDHGTVERARGDRNRSLFVE